MRTLVCKFTGNALYAFAFLRVCTSRHCANEHMEPIGDMIDHNREKVERAEQMEREAMERNERDEQEQVRKKSKKQEQSL